MKVLTTYCRIIDINGVKMQVPDCQFITIDQYGNMEGWQSVPYISEGNYYSNETEEIFIAKVEMDDGDTLFKIFSVMSNRFVDSHEIGC